MKLTLYKCIYCITHIQGKSIVQLMPKAFVSTIKLKKNKNILCLNCIHDLMFLICVYKCM